MQTVFFHSHPYTDFLKITFLSVSIYGIVEQKYVISSTTPSMTVIVSVSVPQLAIAVIEYNPGFTLTVVVPTTIDQLLLPIPDTEKVNGPPVLLIILISAQL